MDSEIRRVAARVAPLFAVLSSINLLASGIAWGPALSQISRTVKDESEAIIAGVEVKATQTETDFKRTAKTDEAGPYILTNLPLGPYRLEASKAGFRSYVQTEISLQVSTAPEIPIVLGVGQVTEWVQVEENASQIETRSVGVGAVIENREFFNCH